MKIVRCDSTKKYRADMFLPEKILIFGIILLGFAFYIVKELFINFSFIWILALTACIILSIAAFLCWKNQTIKIIDEERFEYKTFLGKKAVYLFKEIKELRKNPDSFTLFVADGKVHIESCAILTDRLVEKIDEALESIE